MTLNQIAFIFNRALSLTFIRKKLVLVFSLLALTGLLVVFFRGLAMHSGEWVQLSLTFLPIFLCTGVLLALGIFLIRVYHHEIKQREFTYKELASHSWTIIMGASYFAVPIVLCYLVLWLLLGVFVLLGEIPGLGVFFNVILSFAPFIINLGTLILCLGSLLILYIVAPLIALRGLDHSVVFPLFLARVRNDVFFNGLLLIVALAPLIFTLFFLVLAALITGSLYSLNQPSLQNVLSWFFIMLPFTAALTPPLIFFFHFAAEAHVWMQKNARDNL